MLTRNMISKCERCGYSEHPEILGVHHKDRNRHNNDLSNLEVLCPTCHSLEHRKHIAHGAID
jgi:5-methylcytosine-specific restriction endonuclease McrA